MNTKILKLFFRKLPNYILNTAIISILSALVVLYIFGPYKSANDRLPEEIIESKYTLLLYLPIWALSEEILFRFLPFYLIFLLEYCLSKEFIPNKIILLIAIISSIIFGYLHGNWRAIFIQGIGGLYFSYIFWRYSFRANSFKKLFWGLFASTVVHTSFNVLVLMTLIVKSNYKH